MQQSNPVLTGLQEVCTVRGVEMCKLTSGIFSSSFIYEKCIFSEKLSSMGEYMNWGMTYSRFVLYLWLKATCLLWLLSLCKRGWPSQDRFVTSPDLLLNKYMYVSFPWLWYWIPVCFLIPGVSDSSADMERCNLLESMKSFKPRTVSDGRILISWNADKIHDIFELQILL